MPDRGRVETVRAYYRSIDDGDYRSLSELLTPDFYQVRGDRTLNGREAFVRFMREDRPETETVHEITTVYEAHTAGANVTAEAGLAGHANNDDGEIAVRGRLWRPDGSTWFGFVDVFSIADSRLSRLITYTNARIE